MKKAREYSIQLIWEELNFFGIMRTINMILRVSIVIASIILFKKYPNFGRSILGGDVKELVFLFLLTPVYSISAIKYIYKIIKFFKVGINAEAIVVDYIYSKKYSNSNRKKLWEYGGDIQEETGDKIGIKYRYIIDGQTYECTRNDPNYVLGTKINILANPKNKNDAIIKDLFVYATDE